MARDLAVQNTGSAAEWTLKHDSLSDTSIRGAAADAVGCVSPLDAARASMQ